MKIRCSKNTSKEGEKNALRLAEELPAEMILRSKPSCEVIKKRERGWGVHLPSKSGKDQNLHLFNSFGFKQVSTLIHLHNE